jgi:hypothetical protein
LLTKSNLKALKHGKYCLNEYGSAIQDMIFVARALGIPYAWVDALCILQNKDSDDFDQQVSQMRDIYAGSLLTLVVADSGSASNRFLIERERQFLPVTEQNCDQGPIFLSPALDDMADDDRGPWSARGWTMQEGILPQRILEFKSSEIIWKCCEERKFERGVTQNVNSAMEESSKFFGGPTYGLWTLGIFSMFKRTQDLKQTNHLDRSLRGSEMFELWYQLIEKYTTRIFSRLEDRLAAISGLVNVYSDMIGSKQYIYGLWKSDMIRGLTWMCDSDFKPNKTEARTKASSLFPSWSWASVGYERVQFYCGPGHFQPLAKFQQGSSTSTILLAGPLKIFSQKCLAKPKTELERYVSAIIAQLYPKHRDAGQSSVLPGIQLAAMQMGLESSGNSRPSYMWVLLLKLTGNTFEGHAVYVRVGVFSLRDYDLIGKPESALHLKPDMSYAETVRSMGDDYIMDEIKRVPWERGIVGIS